MTSAIVSHCLVRGCCTRTTAPGARIERGAGVFVVLGFGLGHERRRCLVQSVALLSPLLLQGGRVSEQLGAKRPAIQELGRTEAMHPRRVPEFQ